MWHDSQNPQQHNPQK